MEIEIDELFVYSVSWKGIVDRQATVNINIEIGNGATNGKNQRISGCRSILILTSTPSFPGNSTLPASALVELDFPAAAPIPF